MAIDVNDPDIASVRRMLQAHPEGPVPLEDVASRLNALEDAMRTAKAMLDAVGVDTEVSRFLQPTAGREPCVRMSVLAPASFTLVSIGGAACTLIPMNRPGIHTSDLRITILWYDRIVRAWVGAWREGRFPPADVEIVRMVVENTLLDRPVEAVLEA